MSLLFGGGGSKVKPQYTGLQTQTSTSILVIPLAWGKNRFAPNIIWQGDFKAHKKKQKAGKGLGGGSQTYYTYSASFQLGLCWGEIANVVRVWKDQSKETSYAALGFSLFTGTNPQAPWGYLTTAHPSEALGYSFIAHLDVANYDLGQSNSLPQHSFEVECNLVDTQVNGNGDADVAQIIDDFLTNPVYGARVNPSVINQDSLFSGPDAPTTGDNAFQTYCRAMGFGLSPVLSNQEPVNSTLNKWCKLCNTAPVWTGYDLKFIPYSSETITANGVTYLPNVPVVYSLTDDDYVRADGEDPIKLQRIDPADGFNIVNLEVKNRSNEYNSVPAEWSDPGLIDQFGPRPMDSITADEVCEPEMGAVMAALIGQRTAYIRNTYEFKLGPQYCLLEPMDILECYDPRWGSFYVRIKEISEDDGDQLSLVCEEYAGVIGSAGPASNVPISNTPVNTGVTASDVNPPIIFQPPPALTNNLPQIWAAVSGGDGVDDDPNWGGCDVYVSTDGGTSYNMVGVIDAPARMGVLTGNLAAYGGANPDTTNTMSMSVAMSDAEFTSATAADAAAAVTLTYFPPEGANDEEYLSYTTATLTGTDAYDLDDLYRGLYGTTPGLHSTGDPFARLDNEAIFKYDFPLDLIGETIYIKFVSFNIWGSGYQDIASVTAYSIVLSNAYTYGTSVEDLSDVDTSGGIPDGSGLEYDAGSGTWVPTSPPYGFGFQKDIASISPTKPVAFFDTPLAWEMPSGLVDSQVSIGDSNTAGATGPTAQTDFDVQVEGVSVGTIRFAISALTATFIMASDEPVALGEVTSIIAPASLNGMTGTLYGSIKGKRT